EAVESPPLQTTFGDDVVRGGADDDAISGRFGDDFISGGLGGDTLNGGFGDDELLGNAGEDRLSGGVGDDILDGGAGDDMIFGGFGEDVLVGGAGDDTLTGGWNRDTFVYDGGADEITDFSTGIRVFFFNLPGDMVEIDIDGVATFEDLEQVASQNGSDTVFAFSETDTLTLRNTSLASLDADDFTFV
ncbi:MAG: calcium-binding protein, partial [Bacteroidota bacterium]